MNAIQVRTIRSCDIAEPDVTRAVHGMNDGIVLEFVQRIYSVEDAIELRRDTVSGAVEEWNDKNENA